MPLSPNQSGAVTGCGFRAAFALSVAATYYARATSPPPPRSILLNSDIRITSAEWVTLQSALSCWTSRGTWAAHAGGYEWVPDDACPPYTTRIAGGVACGVAAELQALYPAHRRGLPDRALFVGDSISHQHYRGFLSNSPRSAVHSAISSDVATYSDCDHRRPALPIKDCEVGGASHSVSAVYRRTDRLALRPTCGAKNETIGFIDEEWVSELAGTSVVFINRGAHYVADDKFIAGWRGALRFLRQKAPRTLIVARTTPGGHDNCTTFSAPVTSSSLLQRGYSWRKMPGQNAALETLIEEEFPGVILLDIELLASLRPDAHIGVNEKKGGKLDCLHYREGTRAAGVLNAPHFLLYNTLQLLERTQKKWR